MRGRPVGGENRARRTSIAAVAVVLVVAAFWVFRLIVATDGGPAAGPLPPPLPRIEVRGTDLVVADTGEAFFALGVNYLGSGGRLVGEMWANEWETVLADIREIKDLGMNTVYLHLQIADFMEAPDRFDHASFDRLVALVDHADSVGLYVGLVGLGVYREGAAPAWLDALAEQDRWATFSAFWSETARRLAGRPSVLLYNIMNAPRVPETPQADWYLGAMAGLQFHQWLVLDLAGRQPEAVAAEWTAAMKSAIRAHDTLTPLTIGTTCRPNCPYSMTTSSVYDQLDLVAPHVYPEAGRVSTFIGLTNEFAVGKPIVVSETFPLYVGWPEWEWYLLHEKPVVAGYVGQYDGRTIEELEALGAWNPWLDSATTLQRLAEDLKSATPTSDPLHHYENPSSGVHAYTRQRDDESRLDLGFVHAGVDGHLLSYNPGDAEAVCEYVDPLTDDREYVLGCAVPPGREFRRATGWAHPTELPGTVAWHEYHNPDTGRHRYTITRDDVAYDAEGFVHNGVEAYLPAAASVTTPGAPIDATAVAGDARATVAWNAPVDDGGDPALTYTVTGVPEGSCTATAPTTSCVVDGLTNGADHTFVVTATNQAGPGAASHPSNQVVPAPSSPID